MEFPQVLEKHLNRLALAYSYRIKKDGSVLWIKDFLLPPGYNHDRTQIALTVPSDYPVSPLGEAVFISHGLRFHGRKLAHLHAGLAPPGIEGRWLWMCLSMRHWDAYRDDFVSFLEFVRSDLTHPELS